MSFSNSQATVNSEPHHLLRVYTAALQGACLWAPFCLGCPYHPCRVTLWQRHMWRHTLCFIHFVRWHWWMLQPGHPNSFPPFWVKRTKWQMECGVIGRNSEPFLLVLCNLRVGPWKRRGQVWTLLSTQESLYAALWEYILFNVSPETICRVSGRVWAVWMCEEDNCTLNSHAFKLSAIH